MMMNISLDHYLTVSGIVFCTGLTGVLLKYRHIIKLLLSIELMLLAVNINFVAFSAFLKDLSGQIFTLFILAVSAAEVAVGLAIFVIYFRSQNAPEMTTDPALKG